MSFMPHAEPACTKEQAPSVDLEIDARKRDLGAGFIVRRLLPSAARTMVGPFIFVDHMGPVRMAEGQGLDVRPHPHIHLATVTFLFEGEILHRDSLGSEQVIRPGAVNWMTAGRGIVHSERTPGNVRSVGPAVHGMQLWVALPTAHEDVAPAFDHYPATSIPLVESPGVRLRVIAGSGYGAVSPVRTLSPLFYIEARLERNAALDVPSAYRQRGAYVVNGAINVDGKNFAEGSMLLFREGVPACIRASEDAVVMLLGGEPLDGDRHIWWNFVSSSRERIEQAKEDWRKGRFPRVPGDDVDFIPLPNER